MTRNTTNFVVDLLTAAVALWLVFTGLLLYFVLPPGSGQRGLVLLGLDRHGWGEVHLWTAAAALGLVLVHVALHWSWVCTTVSRMVRRGGRGPGSATRRNLAGVVAVLALAGVLTGGLLLARAAVEQGDADALHRRGQGQGQGQGQGRGKGLGPGGGRGGRHGEQRAPRFEAPTYPSPSLRLTPRANTPRGSQSLTLETRTASPPPRQRPRTRLASATRASSSAAAAGSPPRAKLRGTAS